jgi:hypothetical protein
MSLRLVLVLAGATSILVAVLGIYWKGRMEGAARERPKVEAAQAQAAVASLEVEGERRSAARIDVVMQTREAAARTVETLTPAALKSEDAYAALDTARAARLRHADNQLCGLAPELDGCRPAN